jgi:uncharacterized membrane protein YkvA (DUF1232 family)
MNNNGNLYKEELPVKEYIKKYLPEKELNEMETKLLSHDVDVKLKHNRTHVKGLFKHIIALKYYMMDKNVKWYKKSVVIAALVYFISPLDVMPDFVPFVGYLDDLGVIAWTIKFLGKEIRTYYD